MVIWISATNITTEPVVATITVTPTFENEGIVCDGEDKTFTITVNPNADMNGIETKLFVMENQQNQ